MGSTETLEDIVLAPNSQDSGSINSARSGLELRSYSSSAELEFNKENEHHQEQSSSKLKNPMGASSQVEESLSDWEEPNNINNI